MFDVDLAKRFLAKIANMSFEELNDRAEKAYGCGIAPYFEDLTMKNLIFLDDERDLKDVTWIKYPDFHTEFTVRTLAEFKYIIPYIKDWNNTYFSFDHDIQDFNDDGSENTGYDCLKWLCDYIMDNDIPCKNLNIFVHTKNPVGGNNIRHYHKNFMDFINKK